MIIFSIVGIQDVAAVFTASIQSVSMIVRLVEDVFEDGMPVIGSLGFIWVI